MARASFWSGPVLRHFAVFLPSSPLAILNNGPSKQAAGRHYNSAVACGNETFMVVGDDAGRMAYSTDGLTWTDQSLGNFRFSGVAYGRGTFVAVGAQGAIVQSDETPTARLCAGAFGAAGMAVSVSGETGLSYRLQASIDLAGTNWTDLLTFTSGITNYVDAAASKFPGRFYRVVSP